MAITRHVYTNGEHIKGVSKEIVIFLSSFMSNVQHYDVIDNPMFVFFSIKRDLLVFFKNNFTVKKVSFFLLLI